MIEKSAKPHISASRPYFAESLRQGALIQPDSANPDHKHLMDIVQESAAEAGQKDVALYLLPVTGQTEEEKQLSRLQTGGDFSTNASARAITIPECAAYFFTDGEIKALLSHEFTHFKQPELHDELAGARKRFLDAKANNQTGSWAERLQERQQSWQALSRISTVMEVDADEGVIKAGRASDMVSALQKMRLMDFAAREMQISGRLAGWSSIGPEELADQAVTADAVKREMQRSHDPEPHTAETFVERLARLEKAAEKEPDRGR